MIREAAFDGVAIVRNGSQHKHAAPANIFPCKDGYVFLFVLAPPHWKAFLDAWHDHPAGARRRGAPPAAEPPRAHRPDQPGGRGVHAPPHEGASSSSSCRETASRACPSTRRRTSWPRSRSACATSSARCRARRSAATRRRAFPALFDGERPPAAGPPPELGAANQPSTASWASPPRSRAPRGEGRDLVASFLNGIRAISLSTGIAGPNAARMLANYGAEVFKVESRAGGLDAFRLVRRQPGGLAALRRGEPQHPLADAEPEAPGRASRWSRSSPHTATS